MTILTESHKKWTHYSQLRKCGELTTSTDRSCFGLNCIYCRTIFTRLEEFTKHIKKEHAIEAHYADKQMQDALDIDKKDEFEIKLEPILTECETDVLDIRQSALQEPDPFEETHQNITITEMEAVFIKEENVSEAIDVGSSRLRSRNIRGVVNIIGEADSAPESNDIYSTCDTSESDAEPISVNAKKDDSKSRINLMSMDNRNLLNTIIEFYKHNSVLWDPNHKDYMKSHIKLNLIHELALNIETKHEILLNPKSIRKSIFDMKALYRKELLREDETNELQKHEEVSRKTKLWFFDKFKFLENESVKKPLRALSTNQLIELAKIYEQHPALWNLELYTARKQTLKKEAFQKMLEQTCAQLQLDITLNQFNAHLKRLRALYISDKSNRLQCEVNQHQFKPTHSKIYEQLQFIDTHIGPYRCEQCNEIIKSHDKFRAHVAAHEGRRPFPCKECDKDFTTFSNLELHMRRHTGENPHQCPFCERAFPSAQDLVIHKRIHTGDKPFICHLCGKAFRSSTVLSRHNLRHDRTTYRFQCTQCPKKFCQQFLLKEHMNAHLNVRDRICKVCGKGFYASQTLRQHMNLHSDVEKYSCDICGKKFRQFPSWNAHKKTHKNV